ncbi:hypothetical protein GCM10025865_00420 [Paraoerskovia sediminicola]|uniref:MalQ N-terminal beta-sandwich domain-containing protein n=1 Tax=Paraoerskovia sediminicola TaxID=1138587 RepID=A0ABN6X9G2_9CELL|nr:hypothetical protein GCM10025865_00420 [Paraoerskovia sediminicola]
MSSVDPRDPAVPEASEASRADAASEPLRRLAGVHGVATEFWGFDGARRDVPRSSLVAALSALGVSADTPERIELEIEQAENDPWTRLLPDTVVTTSGKAHEIPVHVDDGAPVEVWVELERDAGRDDDPRAARTGHDGDAPAPETVTLAQVDRWVPPRTVHGRRVGRATFEVPTDLPLGWHTLHARSGDARATTPLVVTPRRLKLPKALRSGPGWGLMTQLYSVRSARSWGSAT